MTVVVITQLWSVDPKQMARVGNSLSRSFSFLLKIAHFKEQTWAIRTLKKSYVSDLLESKPLFRSQKTSESLEKPMSEFPTLQNGQELV